MSHAGCTCTHIVYRRIFSPSIANPSRVRSFPWSGGGVPPPRSLRAASLFHPIRTQISRRRPHEEKKSSSSRRRRAQHTVRTPLRAFASRRCGGRGARDSQLSSAQLAKPWSRGLRPSPPPCCSPYHARPRPRRPPVYSPPAPSPA
jgi:hypothetical protein